MAWSRPERGPGPALCRLPGPCAGRARSHGRGSLSEGDACRLGGFRRSEAARETEGLEPRISCQPGRPDALRKRFA